MTKLLKELADGRDKKPGLVNQLGVPVVVAEVVGLTFVEDFIPRSGLTTKQAAQVFHDAGFKWDLIKRP